MPDSVRAAQTFLKHFYGGEYQQALETFAPNMRGATDAAGLGRLFDDLQKLFGKPVRHAGTRTSKTVHNEADIVYLLWDFERERVEARMVIIPANLIVALSFENPVIR